MTIFIDIAEEETCDFGYYYDEQDEACYEL